MFSWAKKNIFSKKYYKLASTQKSCITHKGYKIINFLLISGARTNSVLHITKHGHWQSEKKNVPKTTLIWGHSITTWTR